jgi:hypothetical protein
MQWSTVEGASHRPDEKHERVLWHYTDWSEHSGCGPLCEQCWQELATPEARLPYYEQLMKRWWKDSSEYNGVSMTDIEDQVYDAVMAGG